MSSGSDARVALLLIVLAVLAVILVTTSPRSAPGEDHSSDATASTANQSSQTPSPQSPAENEALDGAARKVAARWAAAYTTTERAESWDARLARLRPYSTSALIAEMGINSGALELERDARTIGRVAAVQTQDSTDGAALVVLVDKTTVARGRRTTDLVSVTLQLVSSRDRWKVAEVLVP